MAQQRMSLPMPSTQLAFVWPNPMEEEGIGRKPPEKPELNFQLDLSKFWEAFFTLQMFKVAYLDNGHSAPLDELLGPVLSALSMRGLKPDSEKKCAKHIREFFKVQIAQGKRNLSEISAVDIHDFLWLAHRKGGYQEPSPKTVANRQWALRTLFNVLEEMQIWDRGDITGESVERGESQSSRPLTPTEIGRLQDRSYVSLFPNGDELLVALSLSGASPTETALACLDDIDFSQGTILLRGPAERINQMDPWSLEVLERALERYPHSTPLVVQPGISLSQAAHSVTVRLNRIIKETGFARHKDVTATSIRLGAARQILEQRGIEAAAQFLGKQSLDRTADALGYVWWGRS